jgi:hypothetical protein
MRVGGRLFQTMLGPAPNRRGFADHCRPAACNSNRLSRRRPDAALANIGICGYHFEYR